MGLKIAESGPKITVKVEQNCPKMGLELGPKSELMAELPKNGSK